MSLSLALQNAVSGIRINQSALDSAAHNISNVNTEGFTKKKQTQSSMFLNGRGAGVQKGEVKREVDLILLRKIREESAILNGNDVRTTYLARTEPFFGAPGDNAAINALINELGDTFNALSLSPDDNTARNDLLYRAQAIISKVSVMTEGIQEIRSEIETEIDETVDDINALLVQISDLNQQIGRATAGGRGSSDLQDKRDVLLEELSKIVDIHTFPTSNNKIAIVMGGQLLMDDRPATLTYSPQPNVTPGTVFNNIEINGISVMPDIRDGKLQELINMRDTDFPAMAAQIDELSRGIYNQLNALHNDGTAFPPPNVLTGRLDTGGDATVFQGTGTVRIALMDSAGTVLDNAGTPRILDLNLTALGATTIGGLRAAINTDPNLAGQVNVTLGANNQLVFTGVAGNRIGITDMTTVSITAPPGAPTRGFSHFFGLNDMFTANEAAANPGDFAASLALNPILEADIGRFASGTISDKAIASMVVGENILGIGDGSNAIRMADGLTTKFSFAAAGGIPATDKTLADYAAQIISTAATEAERAETRKDVQQEIVDNLKFKVAELNGVSIDEELSEIIIFENAYNASAQVIQTVNEMFDRLDQAIG